MAIRRWATLAAFAAITTAANAQYPTYRVTALPDLVNQGFDWTALNDFGQVVGVASDGFSLWTPSSANGPIGSITNIAVAPRFSYDREFFGTRDINSRGEVLLKDRLWVPAQANGVTGTSQVLPSGFEGHSMNDAGQILGRVTATGAPRLLTPTANGYSTWDAPRPYPNSFTFWDFNVGGWTTVMPTQSVSQLNEFGQFAFAVGFGAGRGFYLATPAAANDATLAISAVPARLADGIPHVGLSKSGAVGTSWTACHTADDGFNKVCTPGVSRGTWNPDSANAVTGAFVPNAGFYGPEGALHYAADATNLAVKGSAASAVDIRSLLFAQGVSVFNAPTIGIADMNRSGQVLLAVADTRRYYDGGDDVQYFLLTPQGASAEVPLLPGVQTPVFGGGTSFEFVVQLPPATVGIPSSRLWFDPEVAVGYEYAIQSGQSFASVLLPNLGDGKYRLELWDGSAWVDAGFELEADMSFDFLAGVSPDGLRKFRIVGIETDVALDPNDPLAFVTGLTFVGSGELKLTQTSLTVNVPVPEPGTYALFVVGLGLVLAFKRRASLPGLAKWH